VKTKEFVMLEKRLLPDLPGFAIKGALLFIPPVEHTLRGFHFEGSDFDKTSFYVWRFFLPLTVPRNHLSFSFGNRLRIRGADRWSAEEPDFERILTKTMQDEVPLLKKLKRLEDVLEALRLLKESSKDPYKHEAFAYILARAGDIGAAEKALENLLRLLDPSVQWQRDMGNRAQLLRTKLQLSPEQAMHQLRDWEAESIRNLGLQNYHEQGHAELIS
jgi:hypothetical protein